MTEAVKLIRTMQSPCPLCWCLSASVASPAARGQLVGLVQVNCECCPWDNARDLCAFSSLKVTLVVVSNVQARIPSLKGWSLDGRALVWQTQDPGFKIHQMKLL